MPESDRNSHLSSAAERAGLGKRRGTQLPREHSSGVVILSVVTVLFGVYGFGSLAFGGPLYLSVLVILLSLGAAAWAVQAGYRAVNKHRVRVDLYDNGLTYVDYTGKVSIFRWDTVQVKQFFRKTTGAVQVHQTALTYTLAGPDGVKATINASHDGNAGLDQWATLIQQEVTRAQLPGAIEQLRRGQPLTFGDVVIRTDAVTVKNKSLAWHEIADVFPLNGYLFVKKHGAKRGRGFIQIAAIPNYHVFYSLVQLCLGQPRDRRQHSGGIDSAGSFSSS